MKAVTVTEFKSHCLRMMDEARETGETIQYYKRGRRLATVVPEPSTVEYRPGQFKGIVEIVGEILVDGSDLGIEWESARSIHCRQCFSS